MILNDGKNQDRIERIKQLEAEIKLKEGLPHLYGWKWYSWARAFFESTNKVNLLVAGNQLSKSSTQIRKCIHWATNKDLWPSLWKIKPQQFWYLYPTRDVAHTEIVKKWMPEFLPQGEFKEHPVYGWNAEKVTGKYDAIHFNSGVSIYFKTYATDVSHLQTSTVSALFLDEECPEEIVDELFFRISAVDGYFHMVFTATLGQDLWRRAMEERGEEETFKGAFKLNVSAYDCLEYEDGSPTLWTEERIESIKAKCSSPAEIQKRVYGRFVKAEGKKYSAFDNRPYPVGHIKPFHPIPKTWSIYSAVDPGSGGKNGHPTGMLFLAVNPENTEGRVFRAWRGDGVETTSSDILQKYREVRGNLKPLREIYDWAARDFEMIAERNGENFERAQKNHDLGEGIVNSLFKNNMLFLYDEPEIRKLATELQYLGNGDKRRAKDDLADPLRYICAIVPWDWDKVTPTYVDPEEEAARKKKESMTLDEIERLERKGFDPYAHERAPDITEEIEEWNSMY